MGWAKEEGIQDENRREWAREIAIAAGVLERCEVHDDGIYDSGGADVVDAYKLANSKWEEAEGLFRSRREMTDFIKEVVDEVGLDECPYCNR